MEPRPPAGLLEQVAELARRFGSDPEFARGGGGNVSTKAGGVLWIKPSGVSLAAMTPEALMPLQLAPLLAMLGSDDDGPPGSDPVLRVGMAARLRPTDERRPSVECLFHALLPEPIVLHTHPTTVNALTCAARGAEVARDLFGEEVLWIGYTDPGLPLARRIADERQAFEAAGGRPAPNVLLLQSHGLIVTGSTAEEVAAGSERVVAVIGRRIGRLEAVDEEARSSDGAPGADVVAAAVADLLSAGPPAGRRRKAVVSDRSALSRWITATTAGHDFVRGGPLTPDQIVYAGSWPLLVTRPLPGDAQNALKDEFERHKRATGERPSIVVVAGLGVFAAGETPGLAATALDVYLDAARIARAAARLGGARALTANERRFIEEWEAEAYRRAIAATSGPEG